MNVTTLMTFIAMLLITAPVVRADAVAKLQAGYLEQGAARFDAAAGEALWNRNFIDAASGEQRSCASCHTADLRKGGKHLNTGKPIGAMAPSVDPQRFTDVRKIEKWFKRNCSWTLGRECTAQEKGDVLAFIRTQ